VLSPQPVVNNRYSRLTHTKETIWAL